MPSKLRPSAAGLGCGLKWYTGADSCLFFFLLSRLDMQPPSIADKPFQQPLHLKEQEDFVSHAGELGYICDCVPAEGSFAPTRHPSTSWVREKRCQVRGRPRSGWSHVSSFPVTTRQQALCSPSCSRAPPACCRCPS